MHTVEDTKAGRPFPIGLFVFLALAGYVAKLAAVLVHELVGHGLVAVLLGGQVPNPDQYIAVAQDYALELQLDRGSRPTLSIESVARPGRGSPFRQRLTASLAPPGPSRRGSVEIAGFVARWNLDGSSVASATVPSREGNEWRWDVALDPMPDSFVVRLWPTTWVAESHIVELRIVGPGIESPALPSIDGELVWRRPDDMSTIDSFTVRR